MSVRHFLLFILGFGNMLFSFKVFLPRHGEDQPTMAALPAFLLATVGTLLIVGGETKASATLIISATVANIIIGIVERSKLRKRQVG